MVSCDIYKYKLKKLNIHGSATNLTFVYSLSLSHLFLVSSLSYNLIIQCN